MKNSVLEFNIVVTIDIENVASWNFDYSLLILHIATWLIFDNGDNFDKW